MTNKKSAATSIDVARLAGVSQSAVSRAFTPGASISDEMRARVFVAASALGYQPNAIARTLITRQSQIVALVVSCLDNPFYVSAIERMAMRLRQEGYCLLLLVSETGEADESLVHSMQYQADGVILVSTTLSSRLAQNCEKQGVPVVLFNRVSRHGNVSSVAADNYAGGRLAAQTLLKTGHQRLAFIAGLENTSTSRDREAGFRDELNEAGAQSYMRAVGNFDFEAAQSAVQSLFARKDSPDALFVANDHMAIAALNCLRFTVGVRVPEDVSVLGFDNSVQSSWQAHDLTTIEQPAQVMADNAVDLLLSRIRGEIRAARTVVAPVRLIVRNTVRGLPACSDGSYPEGARQDL